MRREEAKELLPIIQAFADGKTIEVYSNYYNEWKTMVLKDPHFDCAPSCYRIKPEPKYRPFKNQEECWNEMLKHQPFGRVKSTISDNLYPIESISDGISYNRTFASYNKAFNWYKFADGTPFGIKEE